MTEEPMRLRCVCGWEASGTEEEVIAAATDHGVRVHNMRPTRAEVLAMIVAGPGRGRRSAVTDLQGRSSQGSGDR